VGHGIVFFSRISDRSANRR